jgi:hypothetical protein
MRNDFNLRQRIQYRVDGALSRGVGFVLLCLGLLTAAFITGIAFLIWLTGSGPRDRQTTLDENIWIAITRSLDPGTFAGDEGIRFRLITFIVTIGGIILGATIIGIVSSGIDSRLLELRRGKSTVAETNHTLIISRSTKIATIISELIEANRSQKDHAIVLLCDEDPITVREELERDFKDLGSSRLIVRNGSPTNINDLIRANPAQARAIIVLNPDAGFSNTQIVKTVLALKQLLKGSPEVPIIAEIHDEVIAESLEEILSGQLISVVPRQVVGRIASQISRTRGVSAAYEELLDFQDNELYFAELPSTWLGHSFGELLLASDKSTVIGIQSSDLSVKLCPPCSQLIKNGDQAIVIAKDDSAIDLNRAPVSWGGPAEGTHAPATKSEINLVIGWNPMAPEMIKHVESRVSNDSQLLVLVDPQLHPVHEIESQVAEVGLTQHSLLVTAGDSIQRDCLTEVLADITFDHIILMCESHHYGPDEADARVLLTLMHLRAMRPQLAERVMVELANPADVELTHHEEHEEFIVSDRLVSLLLAQLSESAHLSEVFADLFDDTGATLELRPLLDYSTGPEATFEEIVHAVRETDSIAIGYHITYGPESPTERPTHIVLNPPKSQKIKVDESIHAVILTRQI